MEIDLRVISLGAGVQSSTMYLLAARGDVGPMPDAAIFSDTHAEPPWVYEHLAWLELNFGSVIPIHRVTKGNLAEDPESIPLRIAAKSGGAGFSGQDCTRDYKIRPIEAAVRMLLGLGFGQRAKGRYHVEQWIGISLDESHRAKQLAADSWVQLRYPLLFDVPMRRGECELWLKRNGYPVPQRSVCYFCPFHSDAEWKNLKAHPELWAKVVSFDRGLREGNGVRGLKLPAFLHKSLKPIDEVEFSEIGTADLFGNECEGMCGV